MSTFFHVFDETTETQFDDVGKTTFVFRTEIEDEETLNEWVVEATQRFETTHNLYKIRVFKTTEPIERRGKKMEAKFITIKVEGSSLRAVALRTGKVISFMTLLDFGIRSKERFEIEEDNKSLRLMKSAKNVSMKGIFRRKYGK